MTRLRALVWEEMFFSDMRQRYFGRVAARAKTTDDIVHVVLFVSSSATFKDRAEAIDRQAAKNRIDRKALLASYREAARMVGS